MDGSPTSFNITPQFGYRNYLNNYRDPASGTQPAVQPAAQPVAVRNRVESGTPIASLPAGQLTVAPQTLAQPVRTGQTSQRSRD